MKHSTSWCVSSGVGHSSKAAQDIISLTGDGPESQSSAVGHRPVAADPTARHVDSTPASALGAPGANAFQMSEQWIQCQQLQLCSNRNTSVGS
ncbi:unnamed protein product [Phytophthora fragariaefolia]|uniref:Unnamed protein product n=1 Tax=Phytophthora fragariaefolia TaxID=1490495 RepID=A0A9W7CY37_9STRA|nr:unnamed protein product [Phytophthora fragariaefolia]